MPTPQHRFPRSWRRGQGWRRRRRRRQRRRRRGRRPFMPGHVVGDPVRHRGTHAREHAHVLEATNARRGGAVDPAPTASRREVAGIHWAVGGETKTIPRDLPPLPPPPPPLPPLAGAGGGGGRRWRRGDGAADRGAGRRIPSRLTPRRVPAAREVAAWDQQLACTFSGAGVKSLRCGTRGSPRPSLRSRDSTP